MGNGIHRPNGRSIAVLMIMVIGGMGVLMIGAVNPLRRQIFEASQYIDSPTYKQSGTTYDLSAFGAGPHIIQDAGTPETARANLNFTGAGVAVTDDVGNDATVVNVTGAVTSVNALTGSVVLDPDDLDDTATINKFVTASDVTNLGNLSGINTGDQTITLSGDLSGSGSGTITASLVAGSVDIAHLNTTGTPGASTYMNGLGAWAVPPGVGDVVLNLEQTITGPKTFEKNMLLLDGLTSGVSTLNAPDVAGAFINTLPSASGVLALDADIIDHTLTGDVTGVGVSGVIATTIAAGAVDIAMINATGTTDSTTFLSGAGTWITPAGSGLNEIYRVALNNYAIGTAAPQNTWSTTVHSLEIGADFAIMPSDNAATGTDLLWNAYYDSAALYKYVNTDEASRLFFAPTGDLEYWTAPSGTAGTGATFTRKWAWGNGMTFYATAGTNFTIGADGKASGDGSGLTGTPPDYTITTLTPQVSPTLTTINSDNGTYFKLDINSNITVAADSGTPVDLQLMEWKVYHVNSGFTLSFTTGVSGYSFGTDLVEPTDVTVSGKYALYVWQYLAIKQRWVLVGLSRGI